MASKRSKRSKRRSPRKSRSKRRSPRKSRSKRRSPRKSRSKRRSPKKSRSDRKTGVLTLKVVPKEGHKVSLRHYPGLKIVERDESGDNLVFKFKGSASDISLQYLNLSADMHMKKKNRKIKKYTLSKRFN
jgi:hypothetical protein